MKKRDLLKKLNTLASLENVEFAEKREGGSHTIYTMNGTAIPIPRHGEINEILARSILKDAKNAATKD